jgi:hypothetical protein
MPKPAMARPPFPVKNFANDFLRSVSTEETPAPSSKIRFSSNYNLEPIKFFMFSYGREIK